jgi:sodium transport system permease protein
MGALLTVFRKEVLENLRDRRTIIAALFFGPIFGPLLLSLSLQVMVKRGDAASQAPVTIALSHGERAPNLAAFLTQSNVTLERHDFDDASARAAILGKRWRVIVDVPPDYGERLQSARPAPLLVYEDASDSFNDRPRERIHALLGRYNQQLAQLRLLVRGVDPAALVPVAVQVVDVSTPASRAVLALGIMSYLIVFATLMGGMYLAIDATAGERERGSLESLLTNPVRRSHVIYGKIAASCLFMLVSLTLTVIACSIAVRFVRLEDFAMSANLGPRTVLGIVLVTAPLIPAGAALMTVVASFTRSYREAQSWLGFVIMLPTLPLAFVSVLGLKPTPALMAVPSLGQHFLITSLMRAEAPGAANVAISAAASLALGLVLAWIAGRLYEREAILG